MSLTKEAAEAMSHYEIDRTRPCPDSCDFRNHRTCPHLHYVSETWEYVYTSTFTLLNTADTVGANRVVVELIRRLSIWLPHHSKASEFTRPGESRVSWALSLDAPTKQLWPELFHEVSPVYPKLLEKLGFRFRYVSIRPSGTVHKSGWFE